MLLLISCRNFNVYRPLSFQPCSCFTVLICQPLAVASRLSVACCNPPDHQTFVERGGHCPSFSAVCVNGVHGTAWQRRSHCRRPCEAALPLWGACSFTPCGVSSSPLAPRGGAATELTNQSCPSCVSAALPLQGDVVLLRSAILVALKRLDLCFVGPSR